MENLQQARLKIEPHERHTLAGKLFNAAPEICPGGYIILGTSEIITRFQKALNTESEIRIRCPECREELVLIDIKLLPNTQ